MKKQAKCQTIDQYIDSFSEFPLVQNRLRKLRVLIHHLVPEATEKISYGIPTFFLNRNLIHFAGYKNHVGLYPGAEGIKHFKDQMTSYKTSRGTVQFPNNQPLPYDLVEKIVIYCVEQNELQLNHK